MKTSITCKEAVDYISKKEEGKLSATQRFALWKHLAICSLCRNFSRYSRTLNQLVHLNAGIDKSDGSITMKQEDKDAIKSLFNRE